MTIISELLVKQLIKDQFPQWQSLNIKKVATSGWDNCTFHLGEDKLVRLPSATGYAAQVDKEHQWLPFLANNLDIAIPKPLNKGEPSAEYPWRWSIYAWIKGERLDAFPKEQEFLESVAISLARFFRQFHVISTQDGPVAGTHNYFRGAELAVYEDDFQSNLKVCKNEIDIVLVKKIWEQAISTCWQTSPVWVHGDISPGNLLIEDAKLKAVIDFGCLGVGDPACDLMIAWTYFTKESRSVFKKYLKLDQGTWIRGMGWALWKCLQPTGPESQRRTEILSEIINDYESIC